jgi:hypothetical protein
MATPFPAIGTMSGVLLLSLQSVVAFQPVPRPTHTYNDVFDPTHQREIAASKDRVKLFVPACSKCVAVPTVIINDRKAVTLAGSVADLGQIDELHIIDATKAFVIGRSSNDTSHVILLDLVNGSVVDHFLCSRPTVSPDARRVAYVKFFTPHFVSDVSDEYLVYDSALTPAQNRPASVSLTDKWNVGTPLYPLDSQNLPGDNENVLGQ